MIWHEYKGIAGNIYGSNKNFILNIDAIHEAFNKKNYGVSINLISVVMTCMARDFKQRKRFKKDKFADFDKAAFLSDMKEIVNAEEW